MFLLGATHFHFQGCPAVHWPQVGCSDVGYDMRQTQTKRWSPHPVMCCVSGLKLSSWWVSFSQLFVTCVVPHGLNCSATDSRDAELCAGGDVQASSQKHRALRTSRELRTLAEALDAFPWGNVGRAADLLIQRCTALEVSVGTGVGV